MLWSNRTLEQLYWQAKQIRAQSININNQMMKFQPEQTEQSFIIPANGENFANLHLNAITTNAFGAEKKAKLQQRT